MAPQSSHATLRERGASVLVAISLLCSCGLWPDQAMATDEASVETRRLRVLLLASRDDIELDAGSVIGDGHFNYRGDTELEDYIELCSASGIPFDILYIEDLSRQALISEECVLYSSIIVTPKLRKVKQHVVRVLLEASREFGISLVISYDHIDDRTRAAFGIQKARGYAWGVPVGVRLENELADSHISPKAFKLGMGLRFRRWPGGIRRNLKWFLEQTWRYRVVQPTQDAVVLATAENKDPVVVRHQFGRARNYYISLQSDKYLDPFTPLHAVIRWVIGRNSGYGFAMQDLSGMVVLRMDDIGNSELVYNSLGRSPLSSATWEGLVDLLRAERICLNVMYVPCWADDGDQTQGALYVSGREQSARKSGAVYESRTVVYQKKTDPQSVYDYAAEFAGLCDATEAGLAVVESHGLTHINPDLERWARSKGRFNNHKWYREMYDCIRREDVASETQLAILGRSAAEIEALFGRRPMAFSPPGHVVSSDTELIAGMAGYHVLSSEYCSFLCPPRMIRNDKVPSIFSWYFPPHKKYLESGYPVVSIFHNYDIEEAGVDWLRDTVAKWRLAGKTKFVTFEYLVECLFAELRSYNRASGLEIKIAPFLPPETDVREGRVDDEATYPVVIYVPDGLVLPKITLNGEALEEYERAGDGVVKVRIPFRAAGRGEEVPIRVWANQ